MIRRAFTFLLILIGTLYLFVGLAQFPTFLWAAGGGIPFSLTLLLYVQAPVLMFRYGEPLTTVLFFTSALLSGLYLFLLSERIAQAKATRLRYGLSGSLLSVISVGCVACGALLSPLALAAGAGVPLALIGQTGTILSLVSVLLLGIGVALLYRDRTHL